MTKELATQIRDAWTAAHPEPYHKDPAAESLTATCNRLANQVNAGKLKLEDALALAAKPEARLLWIKWGMLERPFETHGQLTEEHIDHLCQKFISEV